MWEGIPSFTKLRTLYQVLLLVVGLEVGSAHVRRTCITNCASSTHTLSGAPCLRPSHNWGKGCECCVLVVSALCSDPSDPTNLISGPSKKVVTTVPHKPPLHPLAYLNKRSGHFQDPITPSVSLVNAKEPVKNSLLFPLLFRSSPSTPSI
jgi:hypothetical protein